MVGYKPVLQVMKYFVCSLLIYLHPIISVGQINFSSPEVLSTSFWPRTSACIYPVDFDRDNDIDILTASYDGNIFIYENTDDGEFLIKEIRTTPPESMSVYASDLDGDGDIDIVAAVMDGIVWFENIANEYGGEKLITSSVHHPNSVFAVDLDGDNDMDVLSGDANDLAWYENTNGTGSFSNKKIISNSVNAIMYIYAADLDNDNDNDVLSASTGDNKIAWYENMDGNGNFGSQQIITNSANGAWSLYVSDLDNDGDVDVLSASTADNRISWYENLDGEGIFSTEKLISSSVFGARSVYSADIDNDGDMDVLSASENDDKIAWYENLNGQASFGSQNVITVSADGAMSVCAADFDSDGDKDILSSSRFDREITLFYNLSITSIKGNDLQTPSNFYLDQNYPNPFNPLTTIKYNLHKPCNVILKIYNLSGQELETLVDGFQISGSHEISWQPRGLSSGIYFYRLKAGEHTESKKSLLQR